MSTLSNFANTAVSKPGRTVRASNGKWLALFETRKTATGPMPMANDHDRENVLNIWHYSTLMMSATRDESGLWNAIYLSTGYGSVSDQNGMNRVFRDLNIGLRFDREYSRSGLGPRYESLEDGLEVVAVFDSTGQQNSFRTVNLENKSVAI